MGITPAEFEYVRDLVRQQAAIVLEPGKEYLVESRLTAVARGEGYPSLDAFLASLRGKPVNGLHRRVVEAMTTNETSFFRDAHPFEALRTTILPAIAKDRARYKDLTIWCAACSAGQEPYTIAMVVRELPQFEGWKVRILATDLSEEMLAKARAGRYTQLEVNRGLPAPFLIKYFTKAGMEWQVNDTLKRMVEFRRMNLVEPWGGVPMSDLVFMRNVLIYFDVPTKRAMLQRARGVVRPGGYLFLGGAETTLNLDDKYVREQVGKAVCYRMPGV